MEITREFELILAQRLKDKADLIQAIIGPRQVGKTTGVQRIIRSWTGPKVAESADSLQSLSANWLELHFQRAVDAGPGTLLVIDEIQKVPNWSSALKTLFDKYRSKKLQIVILGSASFRLQRGLSDSLAGRYEKISAPHWNYNETSKAFSWSIEQYLQFGGYPGASRLIDDMPRWRSYILDSIIDNVLTKDLSNLAEIRNPAMLRQLFFLAMEYPAQEVSFQKLVGQLQDKGAVATAKHYLEVLESAHLLKLVYQYGKSALATRTSSPKLLPLAPALISAANNESSGPSNPSWRGRVFEAAVGAQLHQIADEIYYWRDRNLEVDFVLKIGNVIFAVEVKSSRVGRTSGLQAFKNEFPKAKVLTIDWERGKSLLAQESLSQIKADPERYFSILSN